ncbi:hypothetical protein C7B61_00315 [filamentous cyanobacterium CCP1]|nr:hypothetical protein C7B76_16745 [filamentous cyanobacterium CCP2]PSB68542.1 hypothetical protein C7B61_00315 [filamentous cyanobacterium CCP1]
MKNKTKPIFQAIGLVEGRLSKVKGSPHLKLSDGVKLKLTGIAPKLSIWLLTDDNLASTAIPTQWLVYPNTGGSFYLVSINPKPSDLQPGQFTICGTFAAETSSVFVGRNSSDRKGFSFIQIENLPEGLHDRQPISLLAEMKQGKLFFVKKIAPPSFMFASNRGIGKLAS